MSEFWWGVLALPIIVGAAGAAGCLIFGAWLLIELWAERRWRKLDPIEFSDVHAYLGQRGTLAAVILAGAKAWQMKLGPAAVVFIWGKPKHSTTSKIKTALTKATTEVSKRNAD